MPYIAMKSVRFDRDYAIGELIPDGKVDPGRAADLIAMGLVVKIDAQAPAEEPQGIAEAAEADGEDNITPEAEEPAEEPQASAEPVNKAGKRKASAKEA